MKLISDYTDANEIRQIMANAKRLNQQTVYQLAFLRLCEVEGKNYSDPLEQDFYAMLTAFEQILSEKHGRRQPAAITRQKLKNKGIVACLEDWALSAKRTEGFETLVAMGHLDLTGEYLVTKYPERFSPEAVANATLLIQSFRDFDRNSPPPGQTDE